MKCPACGNELTGIEIGEITVDACRNGCGGIWFDQLELNRLDEQHETAGESLLDIERDPAVKLDRERRRRVIHSAVVSFFRAGRAACG